MSHVSDPTQTAYPRARAGSIRLRTIILLRWVAIVGQMGALLVSQYFYGIQLEQGLSYFTVGVSVIGNLVASVVFPPAKRLTEQENLSMVMFDLLQLGVLLYLTGGLHNPFSLLIIGPVTISATVLSLRSTLFVAATATILTSILAVYNLPLSSRGGELLRIPDLYVFGNWAAIVISLMFAAVYSRRITDEMHAMSDALAATQMALAREQKLTDLDGVVAAAAHELGTPLATITLTSAELMEELADTPHLHEDAALIREQADRCRDILHSMGQAGKGDSHLKSAPISALVNEAAQPHFDRGKHIRIIEPAGDSEPLPHPIVMRRPEVIHGLRNLIQNAVDFADRTIWIELRWDSAKISVRIADDGPGYPTELIGRIGDPFVRGRTRSKEPPRPGYEGMGLGLFIAKTLLERSGATLSFANASQPDTPQTGPQNQPTGAVVEVVWPREKILARD